MWQNISKAAKNWYAVMGDEWERMNTTSFIIPGKAHFVAVKAHFLAMGLTTGIHKRTKCIPHNALSFVEGQNVVHFLNHYTETHSILLPGRIPGYKRDGIQLLPTCTTKKS